MKPTAVFLVIILLVTCMSFIKEGNGCCRLPTYNQDTIPKEVSDTIGAEYPGGVMAWQNYLNRNLKYPADTSDNVISGTVEVQFVIDEGGNVTDVKAICGLEILSTEAVRVIKKSSKWIPGKLQSTGCNIKSPKKQPIIFRGE